MGATEIRVVSNEQVIEALMLELRDLRSQLNAAHADITHWKGQAAYWEREANVWRNEAHDADLMVGPF